MKHNSYQFLSANRLSNAHNESSSTPVKRKKIRTGKTEHNSINTISMMHRQNDSTTEIAGNHR